MRAAKADSLVATPFENLRARLKWQRQWLPLRVRLNRNVQVGDSADSRVSSSHSTHLQLSTHSVCIYACLRSGYLSTSVRFRRGMRPCKSKLKEQAQLSHRVNEESRSHLDLYRKLEITQLGKGEVSGLICIRRSSLLKRGSCQG